MSKDQTPLVLETPHAPRPVGRATMLRIVTYNIHRCRGLDGRTRPDRIASVLGELEPDIIALQEVIGGGARGEGHLPEIGRALDMPWLIAPVRQHRGHDFGNAVLSRFPALKHTQHDLTFRGCTPRCCQRVDFEVHGSVLQVFNVHLGTAIFERRYQSSLLGAFIGESQTGAPQIVLGDFNEWVRGQTSAVLGRLFKAVDVRRLLGRRRTYPSVLPLLHLDHIYFDGTLEVDRLLLPRSRLALIASDHLPLVADVTLTQPPD